MDTSNVVKITFNLLLVEWYKGIAIHKPSGILWISIPIDKLIPKRIFTIELINVAIPSGKLWIIKLKNDSIPIFFKEFSSV